MRVEEPTYARGHTRTRTHTSDPSSIYPSIPTVVPVRCHYITRQRREKKRNGWGQERRKVEGEIKCVCLCVCAREDRKREREGEMGWLEDMEEKWRWRAKFQSFLGGGFEKTNPVVSD